MWVARIAGGLGALTSIAFASPSILHERQDCVFDPSLSPQCWKGKYNIKTNYYDEVPPSNNPPRIYNFILDTVNLTEKTAPDGVPRTALAINGQIPGPTIFAEWGDTIVVNVVNKLPNAGTSIHFHGVRQNGTNDQDGTSAITQCPIAGDGETMTYTWTATQYGTSWYHSHYEVQAWDGVFGAIHINGPASAEYDHDLGPLMLSDWTHATAESLLETAALNGGVNIDNGLINGTNSFGNNTHPRFELIFDKKARDPSKPTKYRLRLINTSMDTHYKVALDSHTMKVIANDFVPIQPFDTEWLSIGIGQRYDVIITANQTSGNYWFRANVTNFCGQHSTDFVDIRAIVRYDGSSKAAPTSTYTGFAFNDFCEDMPMESLVPVLSLTPGSSTYNEQYELLQDSTVDPNNWLQWIITPNKTSYSSPWGYPTLQQVTHSNTTYLTDPKQRVTTLNGTKGAKQWVYVKITTDGTAHPIHLHGHDFWILNTTLPASPSTIRRDIANMPRRDVAMLPSGGMLQIAFLTDNPGVWLLHCHIGWHTSLGFALTFVERPDEIKAKDDVEKNCVKWRAFADSHHIKQRDSGV